MVYLPTVLFSLGEALEGYTMDLAPQIDPGPGWNVSVAMRPSKVLGVELAYSGAVNDIDGTGTGGGVENIGDPDLVRNGGQAALTLGLAATPVQPYLLGGIGLSRYNIRSGETAAFQDDTTGNVPVGVGLRTHIGDFTADLRGSYNFLFDSDFARRDAVDGIDAGEGGRYTGTLNIGATF